ncbi:HlyD family secretion protein [Actinoplanes palleronii]|uniref:Peptidoglycan-binding protein n=2 Tax=Actinoplanes palleronii TaxID=113570 RepID=A0ABQ4BED3_9ACTN|nr:peptidoglycan-binding protein [Actinoplanes palleronii]
MPPLKWTVAVCAVALLGAGATFAFHHHRPAPDAPRPDPKINTTEVRTMDLIDERTVSGTLGFGPARVVKGAGDGVLTTLPAVGTKVRRGTALYRVDDKPVTVFYGATPLFRTVDKIGLHGRDVLEIRRNLSALGYSSRSTDRDVSDDSLLDAIERWERDRDHVPSGAQRATLSDLPGPSLTPGEVVVLAGPGRVSDVTAQAGDPVAGPLLSITSTAAVVSVPMSPADAATVHSGMAVTVIAPDGASSPAKITAVGRAVTEGDESAKLSVTVTPDKPLSAYDAAPVQVRITTLSRKGVLAVPVGALVALAEGGYAVQRTDGSLVAATTGSFAGGMVQVSGPGITDGLPVVTTS